MENTTAMTDDDILRYTQDKRKQLVDTLVADGKMPIDSESQNVLLSTLSDMDKQAMGKKKIAASAAGSEVDRLVATALVTLTKELKGRNPYEQLDGADQRPVPMVDRSLLPPAELAPGESEVGIVNEKYNDFVTRIENEG